MGWSRVKGFQGTRWGRTWCYPVTRGSFRGVCNHVKEPTVTCLGNTYLNTNGLQIFCRQLPRLIFPRICLMASHCMWEYPGARHEDFWGSLDSWRDFGQAAKPQFPWVEEKILSCLIHKIFVQVKWLGSRLWSYRDETSPHYNSAIFQLCGPYRQVLNSTGVRISSITKVEIIDPSDGSYQSSLKLQT